MEVRCCPSAAPGPLSASIPPPTDPNLGLTGRLAAGSAELYRPSGDANGLPTAPMHPRRFQGRPSVLDGQGRALTQGQTATVPLGSRYDQPPGIFPGPQAPGSFAFADLNGDGIPDLIALDPTANDVLVYLGQGGDRYAAPLRFATGTDPVALTVGDATGSGIPDLIVANAGSSDLSLFIGAGQGADWTLQPRPPLPVGADPVSTTLADVGGIPYIVSVDRGSNDVRILRGTGGGSFDDRTPMILPAGPSPIRAFVGAFGGGPGPGLALLDSASGGLAYYSDFTSGNPVPQLISTGGPNAVGGEMSDQTVNGYSVLLIAHQGDGGIAVLEGGPGGPKLAGSTDAPGVSQVDGDQSMPDETIRTRFAPGFGATGFVGSVGAFLPRPSAAPGAWAWGMLPSSKAGPLAMNHPMTALGPQSPAAMPVEVSSPASAGVATGPAAFAMAGGGAMLPQIIAPSMAPLSFVIENLVEAGQVQVSELMPMDHSALDAVAVLMVAARGSGEAGMTETDTPTDEAPADGLASDAVRRAVSGVESYLLDLDGAADRLPRVILDEPTVPLGTRRGRSWLAPDAAYPARLSEGRSPRASSPGPGIVPNTAHGRDLGPEGEIDVTEPREIIPGLSRSRDPLEPEPGLLYPPSPIGTTLLVSSLLVAGWASWARRKPAASGLAPGSAHAFHARHPSNRPMGVRAPATRPVRNDERPPWLASPTPSTLPKPDGRAPRG